MSVSGRCTLMAVCAFGLFEVEKEKCICYTQKNGIKGVKIVHKEKGFETVKIFNTINLIALQTVSTSKGNQRKWFDDKEQLYVKEQFYFQGKYWRDDLVEVIATEIARFLPSCGIEVVEQKLCDIVDAGRITKGVFSHNFLHGNEKLITLQRVLESKYVNYKVTDSVKDNWQFLLENIKQYTGLDYTEYFIVMTILDYLVGNEDRHLNNIAFLLDDEFKQAPLFDFGLGLFEHDRRYEELSFRECLIKMQSKPFCRDNQKVIDFITAHYNISNYLPDEIDLTGIQIPSLKAGSYLRNRCMNLGINLRGVE